MSEIPKSPRSVTLSPYTSTANNAAKALVDMIKGIHGVRALMPPSPVAEDATVVVVVVTSVFRSAVFLPQYTSKVLPLHVPENANSLSFPPSASLVASVQSKIPDTTAHKAQYTLKRRVLKLLHNRHIRS
eukprot:GHVT01058880.1.p1 GENE.GHVT01058880.1~~GHVT01058880.1.p1  ORF type:complete len:130 (+),score=6.99 GHVT01058880.1:1459-1848(+)